jgi:3-phosphoshikimate 1-carboxyvinyltransferase
MISAQSIDYLVTPGGKLQGKIRVPGDKSISHRAVMLGAIARGQTRISGFLQGEDTLATMAAFRAMGVHIDHQGQNVVINGAGLHGLKPSAHPLDLGNSGTSARLLSGLLAGQKFDSEIIGDASLMKRPMRRVTEPLQKMNADIECSAEGTLPIRIRGGRRLKGIDYTLPVVSAQLKSCLLLAGLYAAGKTCVHESVATRDHTERMLRHFGCNVETKNNAVCITGDAELKAPEIVIPADISSAAFFMVGASIADGSDITLEDVGINPTRDGVIRILQLMGADISLMNQRHVSGEPVAEVRVRASRLRGIEIPVELVPNAIDEFPAIMIAAACAAGKTVLRGAAELRVKESDRIAALADGLQALGISVIAHEDGMEVTGGRICGGTVNSHTDHRIAMAFSMAALRAEKPVRILDCTNVNTSFPGYAELALAAGLQIKTEASNGR